MRSTMPANSAAEMPSEAHNNTKLSSKEVFLNMMKAPDIEIYMNLKQQCIQVFPIAQG
jgi:hypothetical protein